MPKAFNKHLSRNPVHLCYMSILQIHILLPPFCRYPSENPVTAKVSFHVVQGKVLVKLLCVLCCVRAAEDAGGLSDQNLVTRFMLNLLWSHWSYWSHWNHWSKWMIRVSHCLPSLR